jgi:hypothetical protein
MYVDSYCKYLNDTDVYKLKRIMQIVVAVPANVETSLVEF